MSSILTLKNLLNEVNLLVEDIEANGASDTEEVSTELGDLPYKVVHFSENPFAKCIKIEQEEYESLRRDYERLRARLSLVEAGNNVDVTLRIDEAVNNAQQIDKLKREIADYKNREEKISSSLRKTASDFRQVCLSLIGWRVDALKNNIYRLTHQHATNEEDKLYFEVKRDGAIVLLKNDYSRRYSHYVSTYVDQGDSLPAFLAAVNLDMFKSNAMNSTQSIDMSISMSTTVLPNPKYGRKR